MQGIIHYFTSLPPATWTTVLSYVGGATGIATFLQIIKRKYKIDGPKLISFLLGVFSLIASGADYLISHVATSPLPTIFGNGSKLLAAAFFVHRFAVSPVSAWIEKQLLSIISDAATYRSMTSAKQPASMPESSTDFQV